MKFIKPDIYSERSSDVFFSVLKSVIMLIDDWDIFQYNQLNMS